MTRDAPTSRDTADYADVPAQSLLAVPVLHRLSTLERWPTNLNAPQWTYLPLSISMLNGMTNSAT